MVITECQKRKKNSWLSSDFSCRSRTDSPCNISCVILSVNSDAIRSQSSPSLTNFTSISSNTYHVPHLPPLSASVETCTQYVQKNCVRCQALISSLLKAHRYTPEHELVKFDDKTGVGIISITDHAQDSLGDVVFVELPKIGAEVAKGGQQLSLSFVHPSFTQPCQTLLELLRA